VARGGSEAGERSTLSAPRLKSKSILLPAIKIRGITASKGAISSTCTLYFRAIVAIQIPWTKRSRGNTIQGAPLAEHGFFYIPKQNHYNMVEQLIMRASLWATLSVASNLSVRPSRASDFLEVEKPYKLPI